MAKEKPYSGRSGAAARASGRSLAIDRPDIQARKAAAASMKQAGVQSLSGLSGAQGQVARFKTEQNNLRNEYKDKNTSDERKEEIVKDLRGVSRDLNDASRAAAFNTIIREFGPNVIQGGGIMGSDAGARFQQLRGNPNFFVDGRPGTDTFVGNQAAFKRGDITQTLGGVPKAFGDKNLFKQVHPNPLKILLGAATQIGNVSPLGLVRNINKIRTGEPLIDLSFMDRNMSESPSRMKNFYNAYMDSVNKKIQAANNEKFDAVDMDPGFRKFMPTQLETEDLNLDPAVLLARDEETNRYGIPAGAEPGETDMIDDEEFNTLLNQYSLLNQDDLATSLLDDSETEEELSDVEKMSQEEYDKKLYDLLPYLKNETTTNPEIAGLRRQIDMNTAEPNDLFGSNLFMGAGPNFPAGGVGTKDDFDTGLDMVGDKAFPNAPGSQTALETIGGDGFGTMRYNFAKGGGVNTYDVLKLINDTMNDG